MNASKERLNPHHGVAVLKVFAAIAVCLASFSWSFAGDRPERLSKRHVVSKGIVVPKIWDDQALATWALPVAGLDIPGNHVPEREYYALPIDNLRTYPVYHPDHEPKGYQEWLKQQPPKPLIQPEKLKTKKDWVEAGRRVFDELDVPILRSDDSKAIAYLRDREALKKDGTSITKNGELLGFRWIVEKRGQVRLGIVECAGCHVRVMPDGSTIRGAPGNLAGGGEALAILLQGDGQVIEKDGKPAPPGARGYIASGTPWVKDDIHERFKTMSAEEVATVDAAAVAGTFARFNGSPFYITRMADLIGVKDRRYLDATGTHRNRGPEDIARYAILVATTDDGSIGPHKFYTDEQRRAALAYRFSDEAMYALGLFIYSLEPPPNPNKFDSLAKRGRRIFNDEGCAKCHDPKQGYTNNKLTPVDGFIVPENHPEKEHIMPRSVHTDPGLALKTRKGTGLYKVPSLRGLWYRGLLEHSGSVATLEDWFDPKRLRDDYVPTGWKGPGVKTRAVNGHEYGLDLSAADKKALIAFLKTL
jgi:mono/diheme cytochrome c family protein